MQRALPARMVFRWGPCSGVGGGQSQPASQLLAEVMAHMPLSETTTQGVSQPSYQLPFLTGLDPCKHRLATLLTQSLGGLSSSKPRLLLLKGIVPPHPSPWELIQLQPAPASPNLRDHHT